jgi:HEAT repeat protein
MIYDENENKQLCSALNHVGVQIKSVYDLVNTSADYSKAIPVLIEWLPKVKSDRMKEGIARALTVKGTGKKAAHALIEEFQKLKADSPSKEAAKWAIANALSIVADKSCFNDLAQLLKDKRHGKTRQMLANALGITKDERAVDVLIEVLDDADVQVNAIMTLGKLKAKKARPVIERFLVHNEKWVQNEVKKAISKIDEAKVAQ